MKTRCVRFPDRQGTIVVFALILLAVATIGLAGMVFLMSSLTNNLDTAEEAMRRRISLENSRALAVQYFRASALTGADSFSAVGSSNVIFSNQFVGGFSVPAVSPVWTANTRAGSVNFFSPAGATVVVDSGTTFVDQGAAAQANVTLYSGLTNPIFSGTWSIQVSSRPAFLGFDLLRFFGSGTNTGITSDLGTGRTNGPFWGASLLNVAYPYEVQDPGYFARASAGATPVALVSGTAGGTGWQSTGGSLNIFLNTTTSAPQTFTVSGTLANLRFSYEGPGTVVPPYPVRVVYTGPGTPVVSTANLDFRPAYLAISGVTGGVTVNSYSGQINKISGVLANTPLTVTPSAFTANTIQGGFSSDRQISGNSTTVTREPWSSLFDTIASRRGWVEIYRPVNE